MSEQIPKWIKQKNGKILCHCDGGWNMEHEEGRGTIRVACYHCANTGFIDADMVLSDLIRDIASSMASRVVNERKNAVNKYAQENDGEGWSFQAAENQMTDHDYTKVQVWEQEARIGEALNNLPEDVKWLLVNDYHELEEAKAREYAATKPFWEDKPKPTVQPEPAPPPSVTFKDDDIPF